MHILLECSHNWKRGSHCSTFLYWLTHHDEFAWILSNAIQSIIEIMVLSNFLEICFQKYLVRWLPFNGASSLLLWTMTSCWSASKIIFENWAFLFFLFFQFTVKGKAVLFMDVALEWCHLNLRISKSWDIGSCHKFLRQWETIIFGGDWFVDWLNWCVSKCWCHGKGIPYCPGFSCQKYCPNWSSLTLTFSHSSSLALSVSELSVVSSFVQPSLHCLIKLEDNGYFNGNIVNLHKH